MIMPQLACTREGKIREKRERRMVLPSHGVVAKTAWRGIRCSSVVNSGRKKGWAGKRATAPQKRAMRGTPRRFFNIAVSLATV